MYERTRYSDGAIEPVTTAELKSHLRVYTSDDDTYIDTLNTTARQYVETVCNAALIQQTWYMWLDSFPDVIVVPRVPLSSVTSVKYYDDDNTEQTLAATVYTVDVNSKPGLIYLAPSQSWPSTYSKSQAIKVTYVAGYGAAASSVPAGFKHAIKLLVADMYEHREPTITGTIVAQIPTLSRLLASLTIPEEE